jgi:uncharacterized protein (DUF1501 family)
MEMFERRSSRRRVLRIVAALPVVVALPAVALADPVPARASARTPECLSDLRVS